MGNELTIEGKIKYINPTIGHEDVYKGYRIGIYQIDEYPHLLYLDKTNPNYNEILKKLQINKAYSFILKYDALGCFNNHDYDSFKIINIEETKEYNITIKILDFIDLEKHNKSLKNLHEIIYEGDVGPKIATHIRDKLILNETYEIVYKYIGVNGYYHLKYFKKVKSVT